jgi:periplasmic protein TonB
MNRFVLPLLCAALGAACSSPSPVAPQATGAAAEPAQVAIAALSARAPATQAASAATIDGYKKHFAERIVNDNPNVFADPLPKMLKSIVVLDVTIDRAGNLSAVSVRRSNGYKDLEKVAMNSVRNAAPYAAPGRSVGRRDGSVNFLETFLFRDDGRFQIRTLAEIQ